MSNLEIADGALSFDYLLGRMSETQRARFETELVASKHLQDDVFLSALMVELVKEFAVVCSQDSFDRVAAN